MHPRAPNLTKFIDAFQREEQDLNKKEILEKRRQQEYEAEAQVFKILENLKDKDILYVLHGLKYSHGQFKTYCQEHVNCLKKENEEEGECDFLVASHLCFVVLEVKYPNKDSKNRPKMFRDRLKESVAQRKRTVQLLQGIAKGYGASFPYPVILDFTVFCGLSREEAGKLTQGKMKPAKDLSEIIFDEDLLNFANWWEKNVRECAMKTVSYFRFTELDSKTIIESQILTCKLLLGLWCSDSNGNKCSLMKITFPWMKASLPYSILEIDSALRSERITRKPCSPLNQDIRVAPLIFKEHLGIHCLTVEQMNIFKSKKRHIFIAGPAGSGKTILFLGKMLDLAKKEQDSERKILIVAFSESSVKRYENACASASINCNTMPLTTKMTRFETESFEIFTNVSCDSDNTKDSDISGSSTNESSASVNASQNNNNTHFLTSNDEIMKHISISFLKNPAYEVAILSIYPELQGVIKLDKFSEIFGHFPNHHILIDDAQCMFSQNWGSSCSEEVQNFLAILKDRTVDYETDSGDAASPCIAWMSCDIVQYQNRFRKFPSRKVSSRNHIDNILDFSVQSSQVIAGAVEPHRSEINREFVKHYQKSFMTLRSNLRNSEDLANMLSFLRNIIISGFDSDVKVPPQNKGHYIHGIQPTIYFLEEPVAHYVGLLKDHEDAKLETLAPHHHRLIAEIQNSEKYAGLFHDGYGMPFGQRQQEFLPSGSHLELLCARNLKQSFFVHAPPELAKYRLGNIPSAEWPAVTAVLDTDRTSFESFVIELYLIMSRARVYCTIFVIEVPNSPIKEKIPELEKELENFACVIRFTPAVAQQFIENNRVSELRKIENESKYGRLNGGRSLDESVF